MNDGAPLEAGLRSSARSGELPVLALLLLLLERLRIGARADVVAVLQMRRQRMLVDRDRVALVTDLHLVVGIRAAFLRLEVERRVHAAHSDGQLVGVPDEVRPGRAAAAAGQDEAGLAATEDGGIRMAGDIGRKREERRRPA